MEPHWREAVLKQDVYFSKSFEEDHAYDLSTREEFHLEVQKRESKKLEEITKRKAKKTNFFDVPNPDSSVTSTLKTLQQESVFQPSRNYWSSYNDYITYSLCPFLFSFEMYGLMKHLMSKGTGLICVTAFLFTKMFVNWVMTYIMIAVGVYHKQGIFHIRYLLPIAKYVPYLTTGMLVWSMSARIDLYSEVLLYFILYMLAEIYIINLNFYGCKNVLDLPAGVYCYNAVKLFKVERYNCERMNMQEFIFKCPDGRKYLISEQVILHYMHKNAAYIFMRNMCMCVLFFFLLFASGRVNKLLKLIRVAMFMRFALYVVIMIVSREAVYLSFLNRIEATNELMWSLKTLFSSGFNLSADVFMGCIAGARDLPSLIVVQWGATSRIAGSTKPIRDSVFIIILDTINSCAEIFLFYIIYSVSMDHTMLWIAPIIGFRTRRIPLVPIYIFIKVYSSNAEIVMMIVLLIFTVTHLNALICEFESLKFSISLINQKTYLNANLISVGLIPVFYTFSLLCQTIESSIVTPLPVSVMISSAFSLTSLFIFMIIFFFYSFKRFQSDIEFMTGHKPGKVVKMFLGLPVFFTIGVMTAGVYGMHPTDFMMYISFVLLMVLLYSAYVLAMYLKLPSSDFKNLFIPVFFYGPPNHELRKERKRFLQMVSN